MQREIQNAEYHDDLFEKVFTKRSCARKCAEDVENEQTRALSHADTRVEPSSSGEKNSPRIPFARAEIAL